MTVIDAYTHALTEDFYETLLEEYDFQGLSGDPSFLWNVDRRLDHMDEFGVDKQVLTLALPPLWRGMDDDTALELTRLGRVPVSVAPGGIRLKENARISTVLPPEQGTE